MLENLNQAKYSILCSAMSYISIGSVWYFTVYFFNDDITIKPCMYIQVGKNSNVNRKLSNEEINDDNYATIRCQASK